MNSEGTKRVEGSSPPALAWASTAVIIKESRMKSIFTLGVSLTMLILTTVGCGAKADFGEACGADKECSTGSVCSPTQGICVGLGQRGAPCGDRSECFGGSVCRKGACADAAEIGGACATTDDCPTGGFDPVLCVRIAAAAEGVCRNTCDPTRTSPCFESNKRCCRASGASAPVCIEADLCEK